MSDAADDATAFARLFPAAYLCFHRRDGKRSALTGASHAVLEHLSRSGPLTVGEAARHLDRAQSVVSGIVAGLVRKGLLEQIRDARDRRRTLIWLSEAGLARLEHEREVLSRVLLERAMRRMSTAERRALLDGMQALLRAGDRTTPSTATSTQRRAARPRRNAP